MLNVAKLRRSKWQTRPLPNLMQILNNLNSCISQKLGTIEKICFYFRNQRKDTHRSLKISVIKKFVEQCYRNE
jgi:hypothetical protein